ncbi:hypothetical protein E2F48_14210 [Arthrobacter crusticola]|uniref:Uncharacterized protein n=1 Tax=Arthrobacter crusticola TaxID=2547960 RepID=A0A4R5TMQ3_9MICC|nr:hypothetical protein [Arthrobacter crusticola]TDK23945.1 hypothetical protein E2F48_14210 [Arthrobacter crusticola]
MTTALPAMTTGMADGLGNPVLPDVWAADPENDRDLSDREASWLEDALLIDDFSGVPLRRLRTMANRMYRLLDADFPPAGALERYGAVTEELALRTGDPEAHQARGVPPWFSPGRWGQVPSV